MIITDARANGHSSSGATTMSGYSIDDPWSSNMPSSHSQSRNLSATAPPASSSSRPLTWAPGEQSSSFAHPYPSLADNNDVGGVRLPATIERAWELSRSAEQSDDVGISLGQLGKVVRSASSLGAADIERIINLACASSSSHCNKQEFAVALVLVAQVQNGQLPNVEQARDVIYHGEDIPEPSLDNAKLQTSSLMSRLSPHGSTTRAEESWGTTAAKTGLPSSSSFTTPSALRGWRRDPSDASTARSPLDPPVYIDASSCSVHLLPELGGYLFFRHVLYLVKTPLSVGVKRRYSDFVSLHEYLNARFPFRLLPPLPPKRLSLPHMNKTQAVGSGQQDVFLEQRRLALARYTRNVVSHPVLRRDNVLHSFFSMGGSNNGLSEENVSTWKSPATADGIVEEGLDESWKLSDSELMSVPVDMEDKFASTRKIVSAVVDRWNNAVAVFERQVRRMEATAAESTRLSLSLSSLLEVESQTYQGSQDEDVFGQSTNLLISNSQDYSDLATARFHTLQHTLDGLKNARDVWLSLKELFRRHERLGGDPIRDLTSRIEANRKRWKTTIEEKKPTWKETSARLKEEIELDQKLIERFQRRNKRVRVSLWYEVMRLQHLKKLIIVDWRAFARSEAVNLAATKQAAEELVVALDALGVAR